MTERGRAQLARDRDTLRIGPSALAWEDGALVVTLDEVAVPLPRRVRGHLRVEGLLPGIAPFALDAAGRHRWQPIAPHARVSVELDAPKLRWSGAGYLDANWGDEPLSSAFASWQWSRTALPGGDCLLDYDTRQRDGGRRALGLRVRRDGGVERRQGDAAVPIAPTGWGIKRDAHGGAGLIATLEDGPFYARSLLSMPWEGQSLATLHESLSLERFDLRRVQALLPFRMPRRA